MIDVWEATRIRLYATADDVLMASEDVSFRQKKEKFIEALQYFCDDVETMNREYTSRVLTLLRNYVERKISLLHNEHGAPVATAVETRPHNESPSCVSPARPRSAGFAFVAINWPGSRATVRA